MRRRPTRHRARGTQRLTYDVVVYELPSRVIVRILGHGLSSDDACRRSLLAMDSYEFGVVFVVPSGKYKVGDVIDG